MSLVNEQWAFIKDLAKLVAKAEELGFMLTGGELARPREMQELYFKRGSSKTMNSNHLRRLAQDYNIFFEGKLCYDKVKLKPLGDYWESLNEYNRWGGNFKSILDTPHFERNVP
jgi:peptidoglycan L-alanyl-D-glutamate endopeptidase CwlK